MNMTKIKAIIIIVWISCTLQDLCQAVDRPMLQNEMTLKWPATPEFYAGSGWTYAPSNPQVINLASNTFAVVDFEKNITIAIVSNLTAVNRMTFPITSEYPAVINSPSDSSVIIFYSDHSMNGRALRALKVDQSGQKLFDDVVGITEETMNVYSITACRVNDTLVAVTARSFIYLFNHQFETVGRVNITDTFRYVQVDCNSEHIFAMIEFTLQSVLRTRYEKYDPNDFTAPIAELRVNSSMRFPRGYVSGSKLIVTAINTQKQLHAGRIDIETMKLDGNWTFIATSRNEIDGTRLFPVFTQSGYGAIAGKWASPWIEYGFSFDENGNAQWAIPFQLTVVQPFYPPVLYVQAKHYVQQNGYILSFKEMDTRSNSSIITLQFYGDVCGDGVVTGDEQCDGGAHCTYCQCDEGAQVQTPRNIGCLKDTPPGTANEPSPNSSPSVPPNSSNSPSKPADPATQNSPPTHTETPSDQVTSLTAKILPIDIIPLLAYCIPSLFLTL